MKCLTTVVAFSLMITNASAQVAKTKSWCLPVKVNCDTKYGNAGWALDQKSCEQLKTDAETTDAVCKEAEEKLGEVGENTKEADELKKQLAKVVELRNAIGELQSTDKTQQIKGVTDIGKITNSQSNNNRLSKAVVDKSISAIDRFAQKENQSLEHTLKTIQSLSDPQAGSTPPYEAGGHVLSESLLDDVRANYGAETAGAFELRLEHVTPPVTPTTGSGHGVHRTHPTMAPKDVYQPAEMRHFNALVEQYTKVRAIEIAKANAEAEAKRRKQIADRIKTDESGYNSFNCPTCDGSGSNPNRRTYGSSSSSTSDCPPGSTVCR